MQHLLQSGWVPLPSGLLLAVGKVEAVKAEDHIGYVLSVVQAYGAPSVCCCLQQLSLEQLACASPRSTAGLFQGFLSSPCHVLTSEMCKVADLFWC